MPTHASPSRSTRVSLSITEERLAWLDEYAASKKWPRSVLIADLIDGFRARQVAKIAPATTTGVCADGQHQRDVRNGGIIACKRCPAIKQPDGSWSG